MSKCSEFYEANPVKPFNENLKHVLKGTAETGIYHFGSTAKSIADWVQNSFYRPEAMAELNKAFDTAHIHIRKMHETATKLNDDYVKMARGYTGLSKQSQRVVDSAIVAGDKEGVVYSQDQLKHIFGMNDTQIKGYYSMRNTFDTAAIDTTKAYFDKGWFDTQLGLTKDTPANLRKQIRKTIDFMYRPEAAPKEYINGIDAAKWASDIRGHSQLRTGYMPRTRSGVRATQVVREIKGEDGQTKLETIYYAEHPFIPSTKFSAHKERIINEIMSDSRYSHISREELEAKFTEGETKSFESEEYSRTNINVRLKFMEQMKANGEKSGVNPETLNDMMEGMIQEDRALHNRTRDDILGYDTTDLANGFKAFINIKSKATAKIRHTDDLLNSISKVEDPSAKRRLQEVLGDMYSPHNPTGIAKALATTRQVTYYSALGMNIKTATVNLAGARINGAARAVAAGYNKGDGVGAAMNAMKLAKYAFSGDKVSFDLMAQWMKMKRQNPQLMLDEVVDHIDFSSLGLKDVKAFKKGLKVAIQEGDISNAMAKEFSSDGVAMHKKGEAIVSFVFSKAEIFNRLSSYVSGYKMHNDGIVKNVGHRKHLLDNPHEFAKQHIINVNHSYGDTNRAGYEVAFRNNKHFGNTAKEAARLYGVFQSYQQGQIGMIHALLKEGNYPALAAFAVGSTAVGGLGAVPAYNAANWMYEKVSDDHYNPAADMKIRSDVMSEVFSGGLPALAGIDLSGSTAWNFPFIESGTYVLNKFSTGKSIELMQKGEVFKAVYKGALTPVFVKNAMEAYDLATRGWTDDSGRTILENGKPVKLNKAESFFYGLAGFRPNKLSKVNMKKYIASRLAHDLNTQKADLYSKYRNGTLTKDDVKAFNAVYKLSVQHYGLNSAYLDFNKASSFVSQATLAN